MTREQAEQSIVLYGPHILTRVEAFEPEIIAACKRRPEWRRRWLCMVRIVRHDMLLDRLQRRKRQLKRRRVNQKCGRPS